MKTILVKEIKQFIFNKNKGKLLKSTCILLIILVVSITVYQIQNRTTIEDEIVQGDKTKSEIERVDISYTYKEFDDGTYQIYLGQISLVDGADDTLRLEYPENKILTTESNLELIDDSYDITNTASVISLLNVANDCIYSIYGVESDLVQIISLWQDARMEGLDNSGILADRVLVFQQEDGLVVRLSIDEYVEILIEEGAK